MYKLIVSVYTGHRLAHKYLTETVDLGIKPKSSDPKTHDFSNTIRKKRCAIVQWNRLSWGFNWNICVTYSLEKHLRTYCMLATVFSDDSQSSPWCYKTESSGAHGDAPEQLQGPLNPLCREGCAEALRGSPQIAGSINPQIFNCY